MPRKAYPGGAYTNTTVRFPTDIHAALTAAADERDVSANFLIVRAVTRLLATLAPIDDVLTPADRGNLLGRQPGNGIDEP